MRLRLTTVAVTALTVAAASIPLLAGPASAATTPTVTSVDLSTYTRVGRYDLPEPTRTAPPPNSLLAQEASSVTYNPDTDTLFVVGDGGTSIVQVSKTGQLIDSMTLAPGNSPQGTTFYDTEGITYVGHGQFVMTEERDRQVDLFTYTPGGVLTRSNVQTVKLGTTIGNTGLEGVTDDPLTGGYILVKEMDPEGIFRTQIDFAHGTATNGSPTTENSTNLFDPSLVGTRDFSDVFALSNISSIDSSQQGDLLIMSQESGQVVQVDRSGTVRSRLTLVGDPDNPLSIPDQTDEGVTMDGDGTLYVVNEGGGGDVNHPQLWVYKHADAPDQAPTAVTLTPSAATVPENTDTSARVKVADVAVTDSADGNIGTNKLAVTGPDASAFEVDSTGLYIAAGTPLDAARKRAYDVTVTVDDPAVGTSPDASTRFHLDITPSTVTGTPSGVYLSEVSPGSSSNGSYGADWFELSNAGNTPVDLTGWRMNDDSNTFAGGAALSGITSLPVGGSVVFVEGDASTAAAFTKAWFGATPPAGLQVGSYSGSGVGLSTDGDAVSVFDAAGTRRTGVSFGATTGASTLDNSAGVGSTDLPLPTITASSAAGTNGAVKDADGEIGSPGTTGAHAVVTEVAPWGSGDAPYAADWFEVTNTGDLPLDLTGWAMDDSSAKAASSVRLRGVPSIAPGGSAIFLEGVKDGSTDRALDTAFSQAWLGTDTPPAGLQIGNYGGSGVGLSTDGDAVTLFDGTGAVVTGIAFGASTTGQTFDNGAGLGGPTLPPVSVSALSVLGSGGAYQAADGTEVGSPFTTSAHVAVTETAPWGSGDAPYAADWFELTNTGAVPVNLSGWKMDDSSAAAASGVRLRGVSSLAAGRSTIFLEGTADGSTDKSIRTAFTEAWFGTNTVPTGLQVGGYGGDGVGLSTGGDAVTVFDAGSQLVAGVAFGASTTGVTFDNTAALGGRSKPFPVLTKVSAAGVDGAFRAVDGSEVGSPLPDTTAPVLSTCPPAGPYALDSGAQTVGPIAASDDVSGVDAGASTLTGSVATGALGSFPVTFTAVDRAGRSTSTTCAYQVTALATLSHVKDEVDAATAGAGGKDADRLRGASADLAAALDPALYADGNRLDSKRGAAVFDRTSDAAQQLSLLLSDQHSGIDRGTVTHWLDQLTGATRGVASIAIDEAPGSTGKARQNLSKGDDQLAKGHYAQAVDFYGKAWA
jgi:uncharacterized protein YjiK